MDCKRFERLIRSWYIQVQDEAMAPARMVSFMENHLKECDTCLADPIVRQEVAKITKLVLPPSKIRKPAENGAATQPTGDREGNSIAATASQSAPVAEDENGATAEEPAAATNDNPAPEN